MVTGRRDDGRLEIQLPADLPAEELFQRAGMMPIPPYIREGRGDEADASDYQTLFAQASGSVAAPTASLHFTPELTQALRDKGVQFIEITLHVGPATFLPVRTPTLSGHTLEPEPYWISPEAAEQLNRPTEGRTLCVGTTSCRALESAARLGNSIPAGSGLASLCIRPGDSFHYVKSLITNFHLPRSTLLALVSALGGYELIRKAYQEAVAHNYRFYSYGDAMWIV
jgi:S-adenosylmethionine:tRNA ribosyltransferase-isomerase